MSMQSRYKKNNDDSDDSTWRFYYCRFSRTISSVAPEHRAAGRLVRCVMQLFFGVSHDRIGDTRVARNSVSFYNFFQFVFMFRCRWAPV